MHNRRVLVLTGAGVSAESGIPTFRGKDGYWRNLDPIKLATPEAFARDPELVWQWYRERRHTIRDAQPNAAHQAIANLAQRADEFLLVTQNVDDLHERAGLAKTEMVQIHGDIFVTKCSRCDFEHVGRGGSPEPPVGGVIGVPDGRLRSIAPTSGFRVLFGAEKMQRNVRLIANDPAVMRYRRNVKELARSQLDDASIIEGSRRGAGEHQSNVLNVAPSCAHAWSNVLAPLPPCFISGATNRYRAEMHQFEATFLHHANFVRRVKGFENNGYLIAAHA